MAKLASARLLRLCVVLLSLLMAAATAPRNVLGGVLKACGTSPMTGYYRDGYCRTDALDRGVHVVAAVVDAPFLTYSKSQGNDLMTPHPPSFPGLVPGDRWCLCALRWKEAFDAGVAPLVDLEATNAAALRYVTLEELQSRALNSSVVSSKGDASLR